MAHVIQLDGPGHKDWHCTCGHEMDEPTVRTFVSITDTWELEEDFNLDSFKVSLNCCGDCNSDCCCEENEDGYGNGDLHGPDSECSCFDYDPEVWMCGGCMSRHNTQGEALACCPGV